MANKEHLDLLKQGTNIWNNWRKLHPEVQPELSNANLSEINLERANLSKAHLEGANLFKAHMKESQLIEACLDEANLNEANLEEANLTMAVLKGAQLIGANLKGATFLQAQLERVNFFRAQMAEVILIKAKLNGAKLLGVHLEGANLSEAHFEGAQLLEVHLEGAYLKGAYFDGAQLEQITINDQRNLGPWLVDVHWGDANLAAIKWPQVKMLSEEFEARQKLHEGKKKDKDTRMDEFEVAARANRQLALALQSQGLSEYAAYFAYHAQKLQRIISLYRRRIGSYCFSVLLDFLAGYGYKPQRSLYWYLIIIFGFSVIYYFLAQSGHLPMSFGGALVFSVTSFHGRGFFPGPGITSLDNPMIRLAAFEAVIGLVIEISFIATFTQRYFGK